MDVLFLAHRAPFPPDKGDRLRAYRHLQTLARLGPVDLVAPADSEAEAAAALPGLRELCREVHVFPRNKPAALARVGWGLVSGGPLTVAWLSDARVAHTLEALQARHDYGLVWAFSSGTGPWWRSARARRRIMDLCDLDALKWEALARSGHGPRAWVYRLEAERLLPLEVALGDEADLVLVSTEQEAADLREHGTPRRLEVLTNGTPWEAFTSLAPPSAAGPVMGFLGQMDYPPNVAAAVHLAREVLPVVRRTVPGARLRIMGRAPSAEVRALAEPGAVEVTGEVGDLAEALASIAVFVAPLDTGRGIPNKILEAMAAGRATIVSGWSGKALSGEPGRHYLVADGAAERAAAVAELLADPARTDALGQQGNAYVRARHDWGDVLDHLEGLVREVVGA